MTTPTTPAPEGEASKRNQFAMAALPGVIIAFRRYAEAQACKPGNGSVNEITARIAFAYADACIAESQKPPRKLP